MNRPTIGMLTYIDVSGAGAIQCKVKLEKRIVGAIYATPDGGYHYRPTGGSGLTGDTYSTIAAVKATL